MSTLAPGSKVILALGGGAARGVSHIGVIRALEAAGFEIMGIAGTSIGSVFGGMYSAGALDEAEDFLRALDRRGVLRLLDPVLPRAGLFAGERIIELLRKFIGNIRIEDLELPFRAVAANLATGSEVRIAQGEVAQAIRASSGIPGVFNPYPGKDLVPGGESCWLVDGIVVSPVPVLAARELGDYPIIAVNVNRCFESAVIDTRGKTRTRMAAWFSSLSKGDEEAELGSENSEAEVESRTKFVTRWRNLFRSESAIAGQPGMIESLYNSVITLQHNLARAQFQVEPPALLIEPNMTGVGLFDFHLADALVEEGERATREALGLLSVESGESLE